MSDASERIKADPSLVCAMCGGHGRVLIEEEPRDMHRAFRTIDCPMGCAKRAMKGGDHMRKYEFAWPDHAFEKAGE